MTLETRQLERTVHYKLNTSLLGAFWKKCKWANLVLKYYLSLKHIQQRVSGVKAKAEKLIKNDQLTLWFNLLDDSNASTRKMCQIRLQHRILNTYLAYLRIQNLALALNLVINSNFRVNFSFRNFKFGIKIPVSNPNLSPIRRMSPTSA